MGKVPADPPWGSVTLRGQEWGAPRGRGTRELAEECGTGLCAVSTSSLLHDEGNTQKKSILRAKSWLVNI